MKKLVSFLSALLALGLLTACSGGAADDTDAVTTIDAHATEDVDVSQGAETDASQGTADGTADSYSVELDTLIFDSDICSVRITGVEKGEDSDGPFEKGYWRNDNYFVKVRFENKSSDVKCGLFVDSASINGVQRKNNTNTDMYYSEPTAPGTVIDFEIPFNQSAVEEVIGRFSDIELALRVCKIEDYNDRGGEVIFEDAVHIYPYGEENATRYERGDISTDSVIVDNENVTLIVTGCSESERDGLVVDLYCVNKTDTYLHLQTYHETVNGVELKPYFSADADAGKGIFTKIKWSVDDESITKVEEVKFSLHVVHTDVFSLKIEDITLNP